MGFLFGFLYKRKYRAVLKQRQNSRCFLNISSVQQVVVALECDEYSTLRAYEKEIRSALAQFTRVILVVSIKGGGNDELNFATSHQDILISKDDIKHRIIPSDELIARVDDVRADLFINLEKEKSPVIDFLAGVSQAPMRVGFEGKPEINDLMINVKGKGELRIFFKTLLQTLQRINK